MTSTEKDIKKRCERNHLDEESVQWLSVGPPRWLKELRSIKEVSLERPNVGLSETK